MKLFATFLLIFSASAFSFGQQVNSPKLVVGIVVDQMCYDYLYRYSDKYGKGGFKRLMKSGTNCRNTNYNYIPTYTGPGHASIYTGTTPSNHGIVANDWYDRISSAELNCVSDSTMNSVGTASDEGKCSPVHLKSNTVTDQLKMTYTKSKVISMSIKDRGAILPGGHMSDGSYWYDYSTGKFITSTFFKEQLPEWVNSFNATDYAAKYMSQEWNTLYPIASYTESGEDNSPYEHLLPGKTTPTFPYNLKEMSLVEGTSAAGLFPYTPFANTFLADFAIASIDSESLGADKQTDMLCISFSTPDIIGHAFGPYSIEIEDTYLRLDLEIEKLLKALDAKVGKDQYVVFLTADHAVVPVPQYLEDYNLPGGYFFVDTNMMDLKNAIVSKYGADLIEAQENLNIYLNYQRIDSLALDKNDVADFIVDFVLTWPEVKRAFTANELLAGGINDIWMDMIRSGYHKEESGDVLFILEPGYLPKSKDSHTARKGTSHGSAYSYDTHVPLLWYGKGIPTNEVHRPIDITDIAATLSTILYLQKPDASIGKPITEVLEK